MIYLKLIVNNSGSLLQIRIYLRQQEQRGLREEVQRLQGALLLPAREGEPVGEVTAVTPS